jgi:lysophospholipase L1-like esterase
MLNSHGFPRLCGGTREGLLMNRCCHWMRAVVVIAAVLLGAAGPAAAQPATGSPVQPVYLALGDSVAAGIGAESRASGYVGQLAGILREATACAPGLANSSAAHRVAATCTQLQLVDLAEGGSTTQSMITGEPGLQPQLGPAMDLLAQRNGNANPRDDVRFITITIGGNDVFGPVVNACIPVPGPQCASTVTGSLAQFEVNLVTILSALRAAAGPDTTIVVTASANPLTGQGCPLAPFAGLADVVLEGGPLIGRTLPAGLNTITQVVADRFQVLVADAFGQLRPTDFTADCLHPDQSGYNAYTDIFADTILGSIRG